jgi:hypothetical protein
MISGSSFNPMQQNSQNIKQTVSQQIQIPFYPSSSNQQNLPNQHQNIKKQSNDLIATGHKMENKKNKKQFPSSS